MSTSSPASTEFSFSRAARAWLATWFPAMFCVAVIVLESTPLFSAGHTGHFLRPLLEKWFGAIPDERWDTIHFSIRKTGHFTGYGIVGLSWLRAWLRHWKTWFRDPVKRVRWAGLMAWMCTFLVASYDEVHQSYLPSRTGEPHDVLLDCTGALVFIGVMSWIKLRRLRAA